MQLTNYGFLETRGNYLATQANYDRPMDRLSTGKKINRSRDDVGALGTTSRSIVDIRQNASRRANLQNFVSYLDLQRHSLESVRRIYERVNVLAHNVLDTTKSDADRETINAEYQEMKDELDEILDKKFNGIRLFGGKFADFSDGLEDADSSAPATVKTVTKDVGTSAGSLELKFSTGGAADQLTVYQGNPAAENILFQTGPWRTLGNSHHNGVGRKDTFVIEFAPHCPTVVALTPHADNNIAGYGNDQRSSLEATGQFFVQEAKGDSTLLTIRAENMGNTFTYLVDAAFEPDLPANDKDIPIGSGNDTATYEALAFGRLGCINDIKTADKAKQALNSLTGDLASLGDSLAANAAARNRYGGEIESLEIAYLAKEKALGAITDADYAREATSMAKQSIKSEIAANAMSRVTRHTEVLMPLATQRHGGGLLNFSML